MQLQPTALCLLGAALVSGVACHGDRSQNPPVHIIQDMDDQQRFDPQEDSTMFADGRAMRLPVAGTVALGQLKDDDHLYLGRGLDGKLVDTLPASIKLDEKLLERGRDRYEIYCVPCHDRAGNGGGMVVLRGMIRPPPFSQVNLLAEPLGYFYETITKGVRNMPGYAAQLPVEDRWAAAAYVRTLQRTTLASLDQIPAAVAQEYGWTKK